MYRRVAAARVGHLATVDLDGRPHLVPVCFVVSPVDNSPKLHDHRGKEGDDVVYTAVDHKPKRSMRLRRVANVEATGQACLLVDSYDDDWAKLWWVRLDCRARVVADAAEASQARAALTAKYAQYAARPPSGPVIALDILRWRGWSAT